MERKMKTRSNLQVGWDVNIKSMQDGDPLFDSDHLRYDKSKKLILKNQF